MLVMHLGMTAAAAPDPEPLDEQRTRFARVLAAQQAGRHTEAASLARDLESYPLYPYFVYQDLRRRLHTLPQPEIAAFLAAQADSYLAARLHEEWLRELARQERWNDVLDFPYDGSDVTLRCHILHARLRTGHTEGLLDAVRTLWLAGTSLPEACDPVFRHLYASPGFGDALVWERILLARAAGNDRLVRYLGRKLTGTAARQWQAAWLDAIDRPQQLLARRDLADHEAIRAALIEAVRRLARSDPDRAAAAWADRADNFAFTPAEGGAALRGLALGAAATAHPARLAWLDRVPASSVDAAVERYRLREGLQAADWPRLARWTAAPPVGDVNALRWRYWQARALAAIGAHDAALPLFEALAAERDYYGFIAADRLARPYRFGHRAIAPTATERATLATEPGFQRAAELYRLGRRYQAHREWQFELARRPRREQEVAATLAHAWGWLHQAIMTLGRAASYDDLELRFPLAHAELVGEHATRRGLAPARVLAIIRSESAFVTDARSPAGALGLMQLMPATARETARRIGLRLDHLAQLERPADNIALGSAYLAQMIGRFGGNFVMAAAAYNAGPHRVAQWQGDACRTAEIWIDTIPFTETRRYVRRALFYAAVYEWRLGREITRLADVMPPIPAAGAADAAQCGAE